MLRTNRLLVTFYKDEKWIQVERNKRGRDVHKIANLPTILTLTKIFKQFLVRTLLRPCENDKLQHKKGFRQFGCVLCSIQREIKIKSDLGVKILFSHRKIPIAYIINLHPPCHVNWEMKDDDFTCSTCLSQCGLVQLSVQECQLFF